MKKLILLMVFLNSCATPNQVKQVDSFIEVKGRVGGQVLGLNNSKELILQEENSAADELRLQQAINLHLRDKLDYEAYDLKSCRMDMADNRLGGNGEMPQNLDLDGIKTSEQIKEQIGLNKDKDVRIVKTTYFLDQLKIEREYGSSLEKMTKLVTKQREECEFKMAQVRVRVGLPGKRIMAEHSLDDAFAFTAKKKAKEEEPKEVQWTYDEYGNRL